MPGWIRLKHTYVLLGAFDVSAWALVPKPYKLTQSEQTGGLGGYVAGAELPEGRG